MKLTVLCSLIYLVLATATCTVCRDDSQCTSPLLCFQHRCMPADGQVLCQGVAPCGPCVADYDCSRGLCIYEVCTGGKRHQQQLKQTCKIPRNNYLYCNQHTHEQCQSSSKCQHNICIPLDDDNKPFDATSKLYDDNTNTKQRDNVYNYDLITVRGSSSSIKDENENDELMNEQDEYANIEYDSQKYDDDDEQDSQDEFDTDDEKTVKGSAWDGADGVGAVPDMNDGTDYDSTVTGTLGNNEPWDGNEGPVIQGDYYNNEDNEDVKENMKTVRLSDKEAHVLEDDEDIELEMFKSVSKQFGLNENDLLLDGLDLQTNQKHSHANNNKRVGFDDISVQGASCSSSSGNTKGQDCRIEY